MKKHHSVRTNERERERERERKRELEAPVQLLPLCHATTSDGCLRADETVTVTVIVTETETGRRPCGSMCE